MSDIRVSVQWKQSTVFAGENIECRITFKNISQPRSTRRSPSPRSQIRGHTSGRERWKDALPPQATPTRTHAIPLPNISVSQAKLRAHMPALSLSAPSGTGQGSGGNLQSGASRSEKPPEHSHRRSVSIFSIAGDTSTSDKTHDGKTSASGRPGGKHARAASLQVLPRMAGAFSAGPSSAPVNDRGTNKPSPLLRSSTSFAERGSPPRSGLCSKPQSSSAAGSVASRHSRNPSDSFSSDFKFPQVPASIKEASVHRSGIASVLSSRDTVDPLTHISTDSTDGLDHLNPITRALSPTSMNGTPRSSGDLYSTSNNSTETLASEYATHDNTRSPFRAAYGHRASLLAPVRNHKSPEILMMGYGQVTGSYSLDGSLVDQASFEEVKRKGIIGGQGGGGVVRSEGSKRDSGIFGSLGWGNFGDSLGGLLGGSELSSIKEAKGNSDAKMIPILSTPQSILFVDLQLAPGESKSFLYSHPLPRGIPPTHKGRAMKVSYNLVVGTQRAAKGAQRHLIRHIDVPFRVFPYVNGRGDILSYDLMAPHVLLHNNARTSSLLEHEQSHRTLAVVPTSGEVNLLAQGFLSYVESILESPHRNPSLGLLSPIDTGPKPFTPIEEEPNTVKDAIDLAILQSNSTSHSKRSANRFEITRSGQRVAVITLSRPAYRLGETIAAVVDFEDADVLCYSMNATLETFETVDPTVALRSKASLQRVTRRIHASQSESTIFARRVVFSPIIPSNATPNFVTSRVCLEWKLRFEFITNRSKNNEERTDDVLEEVARDERGTVMAAVQGLPSDVFDVSVPLRVYGAVPGFDDKNEISDMPI